jgi:hypothetical protein
VKFQKRRTPSNPYVDVSSTDDNSSTDEDDEDQDIDKNRDDDAIMKLDWKTETTIQEGDTFESMIEKASKHVEHAQNMRLLLQGKARLALDWTKSIESDATISDNKWMNAIDTIIGDYCQNLALPFLGEHQPGETYYFSPLTVNCFGIANVGMEKALLTAYIYHEGEGKKGGNNVASLIH